MAESVAPFKGNNEPQGYTLVSALNHNWDIPTLEWVVSTGGGGGGGGAVTIADGADVAQGTTTDVAWVAGAGTVISLLKKIASAGGGAVSIADGSDVAEGATTDAAVITDTTGTLSGKLRGLVKWAFERMPTSLGQKAMAASLPVVIASDQSSLAVTGSVLVSGEVSPAQASLANQVWGSGDPAPLSLDLAGNLRVGARDSIRLDEASATITYVGTAAPGALTSAASWAIKRLDSSSGLVVLWADGDPQSDNIWDNRAALAYS